MLSPVTPFHLLINNKSGSVLKTGEENVRALIAGSGVPIKSLNLIEPDSFNHHLETFGEDDHFILVGGGDGTIAGCLPYFINSGRTMGVLPLGTMNLLARDLGFSGDLGEALAQYAGPMDKINIDVAYVNDIPFLCCAGLGTMPESAVFRENLRGTPDVVMYPKLIKFIFDQMNPNMQRRVTMHMDGLRKQIKTAAIVVSNNVFTNHEDENNEGPLKRGSLQNGKLGIYSFAPRTLRDKLGLMMRLHIGGWKNSTRLQEWHASEVTLDDPEHKELVSIDGEVRELTMPLRFRIEKQCLSVMIPRQPTAN